MGGFLHARCWQKRKIHVLLSNAFIKKNMEVLKVLKHFDIET